MGQEIEGTSFHKKDYKEFSKRLREETKLLMNSFNRQDLEDSEPSVGLELEAWLLDEEAQPSPQNEEFLERANHPMLVHELSKFNFETNTEIYPLQSTALSQLEKELTATWSHCRTKAKEIQRKVLLIGMLPSLSEELMVLENLSTTNRYKALNQEIMHLRKGQKLNIDIEGKDHLQMTRENVMLEAASTSLQIHLKPRLKDVLRVYNASSIASSFVIAAASNSPFLFGHDLWAETRIPVFEQSVFVACFRGPDAKTLGRVCFGSGYARESLLEPFLENHDGYPPLLPFLMDEEPEKLAHLRLHNGTIWRWNRPIVGFGPSGQAHIRIEHRVAASGPSIADVVANSALYLGLTYYFADQFEKAADYLSFAECRNNFYQAAKHGLEAQISFGRQKELCLGDLLAQDLLPAARQALEKAGIEATDLSYYFDEILEPRLRLQQTGATWQRKFLQKHQCSPADLVQAYMDWQERDVPIHAWTL